MATNEVFRLPELTERIILHLPPLEILATATRICRHWKATIDSSPSIQTKLWLRPQVERPASPYAVQPPPNAPPIDLAHWSEHQHHAYYHAPILLNPLLFSPSNISKIPEISLGPDTDALMCRRIRRRHAIGIHREFGNDYLCPQDPAIVLRISSVADALSCDDVASGRPEQARSQRSKLAQDVSH